MSGRSALSITDTTAIPRSELTFRASRAGGPGGQHVNTSSTRVELLWNARESRALNDAQRARVVRQLAARLDADGVLRVVASTYRSQSRNREAAEARLAAAVRRALAVPKRRVATRPGRAAVEGRLRRKHHHSDKKRERRSPIGDE